MIVVMQCAKTKQPDAGAMRTMTGLPVRFVAQPELAPCDPDLPNLIYARPDDFCDTGRTWRQELAAYNLEHNPSIQDIRHLITIATFATSEPGGKQAVAADLPPNAPPASPSKLTNPPGLLPAYQLYRNKTYRLLKEAFGTANFYIFSAGWGLVRSDFMLPNYDITLSPGASGPDRYKRRRPADTYTDFNMLPSETAEPVVYLGSKVYVPLFCQLTSAIPCQRIIYYNSKHPPEAPNCELRKFDIPKKTDWHYDCAKALAENTTLAQEQP